MADTKDNRRALLEKKRDLLLQRKALLESSAKSEAAQDESHAGRAALAAFADTAGFGIPKYGAALLQTLSDQGQSVIEDPTPFKERYGQNLSDLRGKISQDYEQNKLASLAGGIAGFLTPGSLGSAFTGAIERGVVSSLPATNKVLQFAAKRMAAPAVSNIALGQATSNLPLSDYEKRGKEALLQGGIGALIGSTLGPILDKLQAPKPALNNEAVRAEQEFAKKFPGLPTKILTPAELTESSVIDFGEGFMEQNPLTSSSMAKFARRTREILGKAGSHIEQKTGLSGKSEQILNDDAIHLAITRRVVRETQKFKDQAEQLYSHVDRLSNNQKFVPENLMEATRTLRGEFNRGAYPGKTKSVVSNIDTGLEKNIPKQKPIVLFDALGKQIEFQKPLEAAETLAGLAQKRADINSLLKKTVYETGGSDSETIRRLTMLKDAIDKDLDVLASPTSPLKNQQAVQALRDANKFYHSEIGKFTTDLSRDIQNIIGGKGDFTKLYSNIIRQGRSNQIDSLKRLLGDDFKIVQQRVAQGLVRDEKGSFDILSNAFNRRINKIGKQNIKALLGEEQASELFALQRIADAAKRSKKFVTQGSHFNLSSLGAAGVGVGSAYVDPLLGGAVGLNIALGKIWYSPLGRKLLVEGLGKLPPSASTEKITELVGYVLSKIAVGDEGVSQVNVED